VAALALLAAACGDSGGGGFSPVDGAGDGGGEVVGLDISEPETVSPPLGEPEWRVVPRAELDPGDDTWRNIHGVALDARTWVVAVVGTNGTVAVHDSAARSWSFRNVGEAVDVNAVWVEGRDELLVAGAGGLLRRWDPILGEGGGWLVESAVGVTADLFDIWGARADGQWVVGDRGVVAKWNDLGGRWDVQLFPNAELTGGTKLEAVWGASVADVWAVGNRIILHYDGAEWTRTDVDVHLHGVWGRRDEAMYAVGDGGVILELDRATGDWVQQQVGFLQYWSVYGTSAGHVVAGAVNSVAAQRDADGWEFAAVEARAGSPPDAAIPPNLRFVGVWGTSPDNLYLISRAASIVQRGRFPLTP
jgi:hypothetical protein